MGKREIAVGLADDVLAYGEPVKPRERHRGYVGGPYDNGGPLSACLWLDLQCAYRRHGITEEDAAIFEAWFGGESLGRVASFYREAKSTVESLVNRIQQILESDPQIGLLAVILESCGGWEAVRVIMRG